MVFVTLGAMLILSSAISINAVLPVLFVFAVFSALYVVVVTACLLPGYTRIRAESSANRTSPQRHPLTRPAARISESPAAR